MCVCRGEGDQQNCVIITNKTDKCVQVVDKVIIFYYSNLRLTRDEIHDAVKIVRNLYQFVHIVEGLLYLPVSPHCGRFTVPAL